MSSTSTSTWTVTGMTCAHCVGAVESELREVPGVTDVSIDLVAGGTSHVTVTSAEPLDRDAVAEAVDEAGYVLASATDEGPPAPSGRAGLPLL